MSAKYIVIDTQAGYFMSDTIEDPMSKEELIDRFWCLDECRTEKKEEFTFKYIEEMWGLDILDSRIYELKEYDEYMMSKIQSEGYDIPVSLDSFLDIQVIPVDLNAMDLEKKDDLELFERLKNLYLKHSVECMDATEISNTPVCYAEWLEYEGAGHED